MTATDEDRANLEYRDRLLFTPPASTFRSTSHLHAVCKMLEQATLYGLVRTWGISRLGEDTVMVMLADGGIRRFDPKQAVAFCSGLITALRLAREGRVEV